MFLETDNDILSILSGFTDSYNAEGCPDRNLQGLDIYNLYKEYVFMGHCGHGYPMPRQYNFQSETSTQASLCCPPLNAKITDIICFDREREVSQINDILSEPQKICTKLGIQRGLMWEDCIDGNPGQNQY